MSQNYEDRANINRYLGKAADRRLAEIKGPAFAEYRRVFETARKEKVRTQWPIEISLGLTSYCNLLCKMCYRNYLPDNGKQYMPLEMVDEIVRQCKELKIASFWLGSFTEGLLHPNILYIIKKCGEVHALDYWFTTNGTLLTEDIARAMIENGVTKLHVSLDAATPETYKKIRGGNLEVVEENVRRFLQLRKEMNSELPMLRVTMVEQDENRGEIDAFVEKWTGVADIVDVQKLTDYSILQNDELDRESYKHLHISYLPWNRGANPNQWSIIDNTPKGVTLHYTAEKLDAGDIISQKLVHFSQDDTLSSSYQKLIQAAMELFKETFEEYHHWQDMRKTPVFYGSYHSNADYIPYRQLLGDNYNITIQEFIRIVGAMQNENGDI